MEKAIHFGENPLVHACGDLKTFTHFVPPIFQSASAAPSGSCIFGRGVRLHKAQRSVRSRHTAQLATESLERRRLEAGVRVSPRTHRPPSIDRVVVSGARKCGLADLSHTIRWGTEPALVTASYGIELHQLKRIKQNQYCLELRLRASASCESSSSTIRTAVNEQSPFMGNGCSSSMR